MSPVEAMFFGAKVVTTKCTCIPEVTQQKAIYVEDPYNAEEWITKIKFGVCRNDIMDYKLYNYKIILKKYLDILLEKV